jgi:hypothetical protein
METKGKILWRDVGIFSILFEKGIFLILFLISSSFLLFKLNNIEFFFVSLLAVLFLVIFITSLNKNYSFIFSNGLLAGNIVSGKLEKIINFKPKNKFISWKDISEIKIIKKPVKFSFVVGYPFFLIVTDKNREIYECLLNNPKSFVQALKKINKSRLLKK